MQVSSNNLSREAGDGNQAIRCRAIRHQAISNQAADNQSNSNAKSKKSERAFTFVELCIAAVIIGVLMAGTLQGYKMLENARVVREIKNIESYRVAVSAFHDMYKFMPGDLPKAYSKIPGCGLPNGTSWCDTSGAGDHVGDAVVGDPDWDIEIFQSYPLKGVAPTTEMAANGSMYYARYAETILFWYQLELAGFIKGVVTDFGVKSEEAVGEFGESLPASSIRGGYWVGSLSGVSDIAGGMPSNDVWGRPTHLGPYPSLGVVIVAVPKVLPTNTWHKLMLGPMIYNEPNYQALKPHMAAMLDRKLDDGIPSSGVVHSTGHTESCYSGASPYVYAETVDSYDCGLVISLYN